MKSLYQFTLTFFFMLLISNAILGQDALEYSITITKNSATLTPETESFSLNKGEIAFRTDLNHDGRQDLIIGFANCGNGGDCIYGFFIANTSGKYQSIFEEYLSPFTLAETTTTHNGVKWKDINVSERSQDKQGMPVVVTRKMFFNGEVYTIK